VECSHVIEGRRDGEECNGIERFNSVRESTLVTSVEYIYIYIYMYSYLSPHHPCRLSVLFPLQLFRRRHRIIALSEKNDDEQLRQQNVFQTIKCRTVVEVKQRDVAELSVTGDTRQIAPFITAIIRVSLTQVSTRAYQHDHAASCCQATVA